MIYSLFQPLTKHLAGSILAIYCWEHLKKTQQKFLAQHSPAKKEKAGRNVISSVSNRNIFTFPDSVTSLSWTELHSSASLLRSLYLVITEEAFRLGFCFSNGYECVFMTLVLL